MSDLLKYEKQAAADWSYFDKFASLLAEKQLYIVRSKSAPTAYINLNTNTITVPYFCIDDKDTFLLMLAHEVSHAMHTPPDWYKIHNEGHISLINSDRLMNICLNIVEDIRIERLIRRKFPGFVSTFVRGYQKLLGSDFFSLDAWDEFKIHDRVNAYAKLNKNLPYALTDREMSIYRYVADTETFDDVREKARYLYNIVKEEIMKDRIPQSSEGDGDSGECITPDLNSDAIGDMHYSVEENDREDTPGDSIMVDAAHDEVGEHSDQEFNATPVGESLKSKIEEALEKATEEMLDNTARNACEYRPPKKGSSTKLPW